MKRREMMRAGLGLVSMGMVPGLTNSMAQGAPLAGDRPRVAAVVTTCYYRSHGHVLLENFFADYPFNGQRTDPGCDVVAIYLDQSGPRDILRPEAERLGIPIYPTIAEALCQGGRSLDVDAVLIIGEHGDYPRNARGQVMYPRRRFFDEVADVFEASGRVAPIFNDKHLSYDWANAKAIYDRAKRLGIPFLAGSSVPLAQRWPSLELPMGVALTEAVSIHGGPLESYDFHGLEVLQSLVEGRSGGEPGVARVRHLEGDAIWEAAEQGLWSVTLADAAMLAETGPGQPSLPRLVERPPFNNAKPRAIILEYEDGFRGTVLQIGGSGTRWNAACQVQGESEPRWTRFYVGPWNNRNLFKALAHAIQVHFRRRDAPYPVERTLLVTGVLDRMLESRERGGVPIETPELGFGYRPTEFRSVRERGASWRLIPEGTSQPEGFHRFYD